MEIVHCQFQRGIVTAPYNGGGGALEIKSPDNTVSFIRKTNFLTCEARSTSSNNLVYGGALYFQGGHLQVEQCCVLNCQAQRGTFAHATSARFLEMYDNAISNCRHL
jgi:hypothetical protein